MSYIISPLYYWPPGNVVYERKLIKIRMRNTIHESPNNVPFENFYISHIMQRGTSYSFFF